jgi:ribonuclease P protein component
MDRTFTAAERLRRQNDIDAVYAGGRRWHGRLLRIHVKDHPGPLSRLAVSVPRRVCGAVGRNRWKRLIRESFRLNKEAIGPGLDLIVVPTRPPGDLKRPEVEACLVELVLRHRGRRT